MFDRVSFSGRDQADDVAADGGRFRRARKGGFLCESQVRRRKVADMAGNAVQSHDVIGDVKDALMLRSAGARLKKNEGVLSKEGKRNVHSRRSQV